MDRPAGPEQGERLAESLARTVAALGELLSADLQQELLRLDPMGTWL